MIHLDTYEKNLYQSIDFSHIRAPAPASYDFHLHNQYEIYFFISGNVNYFIEKKIYPLHYGDLLVMNSHEIHKPSFLPGKIYERIVIHFDPGIVRFLSPPDFNLLECFENRPLGEKNKICLYEEQVEEILKLFKRMEAYKNNRESGYQILMFSCFTELLVLINRIFRGSILREEQRHIPEKLIPVLDYIDANLDGDLTLEKLEGKFFINRFYMSRLFKKSTGSNLHNYIITKRISLAKRLLSEGCSVIDACMLCGFNDYANFCRMFKRIVGLSPGKYAKLS